MSLYQLTLSQNYWRKYAHITGVTIRFWQTYETIELSDNLVKMIMANGWAGFRLSTDTPIPIRDTFNAAVVSGIPCYLRFTGPDLFLRQLGDHL